MRRHVVIFAGAMALFCSCAGTTKSPATALPAPQREQIAAQASNAENRVRTYVQRFQEAQEKASEYRGYAAQAETALNQITAEVQTTQELRVQKTKELEALRAEAQKVAADMDSARNSLAQAQQELQRLQSQQAEAAKAMQGETVKQRELVERLEGMRKDNTEVAEKVDLILKHMSKP